jgi:hypothetical protein
MIWRIRVGYEVTKDTNPEGVIGSSFKPFWIGLRPIVFNNRYDATARRFIWLRQMRDVKRRKSVRSTHFVAPSRRRGY